MRRFYQPVDLRSRQEMTQYLTTHFRYPTLNSWNRSTSYACNLKITHLGLSPEVVDKLFDMIQTQEFFDAMDECKWEFAAKHNYLWQAGMNGRSGGDWSMHALRERVKLVQELDQLADRMVELALRLTREAQVIEEEYFLPQTRKVLVTTL